MCCIRPPLPRPLPNTTTPKHNPKRGSEGSQGTVLPGRFGSVAFVPQSRSTTSGPNRQDAGREYKQSEMIGESFLTLAQLNAARRQTLSSV